MSVEAVEHIPAGGETARRRAICDAALDLLVEVGYDRMSMDAVATRAKASKATIYRHWAGKRDLVVEALRMRGPTCIETPDTGSLRGDLIATLRCAGEGMLSEERVLVTGVMNALRGCEDLADFVRNEVVESKRSASRVITERAVVRGELPEDADPDVFYEVAPALVFFRLSVVGLPVDHAYLEHLADDVLIPLMSRRPGERPHTGPAPLAAAGPAAALARTRSGSASTPAPPHEGPAGAPSSPSGASKESS